MYEITRERRDNLTYMISVGFTWIGMRPISARATFLLLSLLVLPFVDGLAMTAGVSASVPAPFQTQQVLLPHEVILPIRQALDSMVLLGTLDQGEHNALAKELEKAMAKVFEADAEGVIKHLEHFVRKTQNFIQEQILSPEQGQALISMANTAVGHVQISAFAPLPVRITDSGTVCPDHTGCVYATFHVALSRGGDIGAAPDGSAERPFHTIIQALDRAAELGVCGVEIMVDSGAYTGDLMITRNTRVLGAGFEHVTITGSIINNGPYDLTVQDLTLTSAAGVKVPEAGTEGAVLVNHPCAVTRVVAVEISQASKYGVRQQGGELTLNGVLVDGTIADLNPLSDPGHVTGAGVFLTDGVNAFIEFSAFVDSERYGIRQKGGALNLFNVDILGTKAQNELSASGTAIWLSDGVLTVMDVVNMARSESSALIVENTDTDVLARHVAITNTDANPHLWEGFAGLGLPGPVHIPAVWVLQGAFLRMEWSNIRDSELIALLAQDEGTRVEFADGGVSHTTELEIPNGDDMIGGMNIVATDSASIELWDFISELAELAGLQLLNGGTIDAHHGEVSNNHIGANVQDLAFDLARIQDFVTYPFNDRTLVSSALPLPEQVAGP
jgi:hypothetical protein